MLLHVPGLGFGDGDGNHKKSAARNTEITRMSCLRYAIAVVADEKERADKKAELAVRIARKFEKYVLKK